LNGFTVDLHCVDSMGEHAQLISAPSPGQHPSTVTGTVVFGPPAVFKISRLIIGKSLTMKHSKYCTYVPSIWEKFALLQLSYALFTSVT
jgi:hypothetical protein